jgi:tetratricopeptide (TPR) repeat protein
MKIAIYTIAKDEASNVWDWSENTKDADYRIIGVDIRTRDNTDSILTSRGIVTIPIDINPWRFDYARNAVLSNIPHDIDVCVSLDLDERLTDNWREVVEKEWEEGLGILHYNYVYLWKNVERRIPLTTSLGYKCHSRHNYTWQNPVHENLKYIGIGEEKKKITDKFSIHHFPDVSKERNYLEILNRTLESNPNDSWTVHLRARDHFVNKNYKECIVDCKKYLELTQAYTDTDICLVRSEMLRTLSRCKHAINDYMVGELQINMMRAVSESPNQRENWVYLAESWLMFGDLYSALAAFNNAYQIKDRNNSPECEERCWDDRYVFSNIQTLKKKLGMKKI